MKFFNCVVGLRSWGHSMILTVGIRSRGLRTILTLGPRSLGHSMIPTTYYMIIRKKFLILFFKLVKICSRIFIENFVFSVDGLIKF